LGDVFKDIFCIRISSRSSANINRLNLSRIKYIVFVRDSILNNPDKEGGIYE